MTNTDLVDGNEDVHEKASIDIPADQPTPTSVVQLNLEESRFPSSSTTRLGPPPAPILHRDGIISLDLSFMNLKTLPCDLDEIKVVQHLYLEGNRLEELPENLFPTLTNLKWLDVRNNKLAALPKDIAYHSSLETLLLQGNNITALPLEIGLVPNLKGIQLQGNPIKYPPPEVLARGVQNLLGFLREEMEISTPSNVRPIAEPFYQTTKEKDIIGRKCRKIKSMSCPNADLRKMARSPERYYLSKVPPLTCVGITKPLLMNNKSRPKSHIYIKYDTREAGDFGDGLSDLEGAGLCDEEMQTIQEILSAQQMHKVSAYDRKMAKREAKLRQRYVRDMLMIKLKEMLEKQAKILQKRLDQATLKEWRSDYQMKKRNLKQKHFEICTPYDTDPNLVFDGTEKPRPARMVERLRDVSEEMADIFISLKNMSESKIEENLSPRTKQRALDSEIKQLAELQKKLEVIKCRNAKEDAISKISERNMLRKGIPHFPQKNSK